MQTLCLGRSNLTSSRLVYGCMRIVGENSSLEKDKGKKAIRTAIDEGYTHFDHADIYGNGKCESLFSEILDEKKNIRDQILITSKCGIRWSEDPTPNAPHRYDFTKDWIIQSAEKSLKRLKTEYLDLYLLHRPDYLMDPSEVASALSELLDSGKIRNVGVSNFSPSQVRLLENHLSHPILVNQVEINIHNINSLLDGTLDQCMELNISPQAWCPIGGVAYPAWGNTFTKETEARLRKEFSYQSEKYGVPNWVIILGWLLLHPAKILPIIGSTNPERIKMAKEALDLNYTREDWYRLLEARNGHEVA